MKDNAPRHRSGAQTGPVQHHAYRKGPWEVTTYWATVAGRQTLVGLDVRSFTEPDGDPLPDGYAEITQRVLRNLSVSTIREEARESLVRTAILNADDFLESMFADERMIAALRAEGHVVQVDGDAIQVDGSPVDPARFRFEVMRAYAQSVGTMTQAGRQRLRAPAVGRDFLAIVAAHYQAGYAEHATTIARYVEEQLQADGTLMPGERGARDRVRKWIQRAREEGLLPPAGQPPVAEPTTPRKGTPRKATPRKRGRR